jgi:trehalose 6-phosphate synthase/phosphatase
MSQTDDKERRLVVVSNRLPFTARVENGKLQYSQSAGGLATGLSAFLDSYKYHFPADKKHLWVGWPGSTIDETHRASLRAAALADHQSYPVFLSEEEMDLFYLGFCNKTLWPLFHYFPTYTEYNQEYWENYRKVNQHFADTIVEIAEPNDMVWIQDYHLMLLPRLLRQQRPDLLTGFFLHIPFPSFEIFRLLPLLWKTELLNGVLGADLIGFHTYEYTHHFLQSVLRVLGYDHHMGRIALPYHVVKVETFPMGIDFERFARASTHEETEKEKTSLRSTLGSSKVILSVDRLDYTKGIINRLQGYEFFLDTYPEFRGKVVLIALVVPSRIGVDQYEMMKKQIEEYVGRINGRFGSVGWTPVIYQYKHLSIHPLSALYGISDVALVTPLRDGMNLIAKEYIASRTDGTGVLILSEMAGASKELGEALIVNPNDRSEIASALKEALLMPVEDQKRRNASMQERLRRYDVVRWASDFVGNLADMKSIQEDFNAKLLTQKERNSFLRAYASSTRRLLLLDYDGTLVPFARRPQLAIPPPTLLSTLNRLSSDTQNSIVLISGRDRGTLFDWFGHLPIALAAEHGFWLRDPGSDWKAMKHTTQEWKGRLMPVVQQYVDRLPGSFIEEKENSLAWHYRTADPDQARPLAAELMDHLVNFTANIDVQVLQGNKVVELRHGGVNKGTAALHWISQNNHDFIVGIGDDWTDEDLFAALPKTAYSFRVGVSNTNAKYNLRDVTEVVALLNAMMSQPR